MNKKRTYLYAYEAEYLGLDVKPDQKGRNKARYWLTQDQIKELERCKKLGFEEVANKTKVNPEYISHYWREIQDENGKKIGNAFIKNDVDKIQDISDNLESIIDKILSKYNKKTFKLPVLKSSKKALKVTTSDDHVGLDPNPNNEGLFMYEYNGEIYKQSYDKIFLNILKEHKTHGFFDLILLDNLGDEQDGYNKQTLRGGHELDQNMSNTEVFETCVDVKIELIEKIISSNITNKVILRKVVNDNHSGDFGHLVNITVKKIINRIYSSDLVEIETLTRFLEHRIYGDHCFILTHGKDRSKMFKGLPLQLNDKTINFINDYISHYDIKSKYIHVEKGDLHQIGYNKCRSFDYRNFMSFAPPSNWVQHNFGDCYSGFSIQVIPKHSNEISHTDYFLNYKKIK